MRQIFPTPTQHGEPSELESIIAAETRRHPDGRPWVFTNMVTSVDGAASADGRSGALGGEGDRRLFSTLRAQADVIVAGAETVRVEGYRLTRQPEGINADGRAGRNQALRPRLCVVTRQRRIDEGVPLLEELPDPGAPCEPWQRPILATIAGGPTAPPTDPRLDVWELGTDSVNLPALLERLASQGMARVLCEGGPTILGQFAEAGLIDEWNFTIDASIAGGTADRPTRSREPIDTKMRLDRVLTDDDSTLFTRYLTVR